MTDIDMPEPTPGTEIAGDFERRGTKMSERQKIGRASCRERVLRLV